MSDLGSDSGAADSPSSTLLQKGIGTLHARHEAQLGPKTTGVITKLTVDEGDRVRKGQLLFTLDSEQAALRVDQAKTALSAAKINFQAAELDFARTKELSARGSLAPATFDQVKARYDGAQAAVDQAQVLLSQAEKGAADTSVFAPFDGVVTAKLKSVGEIATMTPPSVVLVIQDINHLELRARMPERALKRLEAREPLEVYLPALNDRRTVAISRINPTIDARSRTLEIVAEITNADGRLKPGMLAEVQLRDGASDAGKDAVSVAGDKGG